MKEKSIYITIRLDLESKEEITEEVIQEIVSDLYYDIRLTRAFNEIEKDTISLVDTEICGINE